MRLILMNTQKKRRDIAMLDDEHPLDFIQSSSRPSRDRRHVHDCIHQASNSPSSPPDDISPGDVFPGGDILPEDNSST